MSLSLIRHLSRPKSCQIDKESVPLFKLLFDIGVSLSLIKHLSGPNSRQIDKERVSLFKLGMTYPIYDCAGLNLHRMTV